MDKIRVLIVEDDKDWLRGLSAFIVKEPDLQIVAQAETAEAALKAARQTTIDVVLMDIMLANSMEGIRLTAEISQTCSAKIIMLTSMAEKEIIFDAFKAGAIDYIVKTNYMDIPQAIRSAYRNSSPIDASVAEQMREEFRRLKQLEQDYKAKQFQDLITPTELQVLNLIDKGLNQREIAAKFFVSIRTIKVHVGNILRKLDGKSSKEAAKRAKDLGILNQDEEGTR